MVERSTCHEKRYGYLWIFAMDICASIPVSSYRPHNENLSTGFELRGAGSDPNDCIPESHDLYIFCGGGVGGGNFSNPGIISQRIRSRLFMFNCKDIFNVRNVDTAPLEVGKA